MSKLTLIRGLPGSGKSTLAKTLKSNSCLHFEADMYFTDNEGNYHFDHTKIKDAHHWCQQSVKLALEHGYDVVVSNTFVKKWEMDFYLSLQPQASITTCQGTYGNVHGVPEDIVQRMKNTRED